MTRPAPLTEEQVIWAYRVMLRREPSSKEEIAHQITAFGTLDALRAEFARSTNFKHLIQNPSQAFIPPFLLPKAARGRITIDVPTLGRPRSQMCSASQLQEPSFIRFCTDVGIAPSIVHRKHWEWAYICRVLETHGMIEPGKRGVAFAIGRERLPAYFASQGVDILATDAPAEVADMWAPAKSEEPLYYPEVVTREAFDQHVSFRPVDMTDIPADLGTFDFLWSSCSIEHLGSLEAGFDFVLRSLEHVKPRGIAVHTTEFNLSSNEDTLDSGPTCLYRKQDLDAFAERVRALGHHVLPMNFFPGGDALDAHIDYPPYGPPHLKVALEQYITTSFGFAIVKG